MDNKKKKKLLDIAGQLLRQVDEIKELTTPVPDDDEYVGEMYPLCEPQFAQIDCRVTNCKYYKGAGVCSNVAPAIVLNEDGTFWCKSKVEIKKKNKK